jgi:thioredoxin:protein disulfide reductase
MDFTRRAAARMTIARSAWMMALAACLLAVAPARAQAPPPPAKLTPLVERDTAAPGGVIRLALRVELPEGLHTNSNKPRDPALIPLALTIAVPAGVTVQEIVYPEPGDLAQVGADEPLSVFEREFVIGAVLSVAPGTSAGRLEVPARLRYQACDDVMCYVPRTLETGWTVRVGAPAESEAPRHADVFGGIRFGSGDVPAPVVERPPAGASAPDASFEDIDSVMAALDHMKTAGVTAGYLNASSFLTFVHNAEQGIVEKGWFEERGLLAVLLIVLVGGLALNLTPCVLPMIPINLAIIGAGAQAGSRRRGFLLGATYGGAMAIVYGTLGLVVILTASTFGGINASPWFNAGIAALFVVLALAMFDVIAIDFSRFSSRFRIGEAGRGTFALAFTLGAIAAVLAGACVAPVVIQVVLFASNLYATGTGVALALPFLLGLGMAIPWPIAGAGIAALPKPGPWMVRVKQAFGVFILATALYYGYVAYGLFANRWVDSAQVQASVEQMLEEGWYSNLGAGLAAAEREQKPVLIDFWATWCKTCLTMDKTTLKDADVEAALAGYVKVKVQAERPDEPPASTLMRRFGAIGLPTYVILQPDSPSSR